MLAVLALLFLLCSVPVSHSAPLACEQLLRPVAQLTPGLFEGHWAMVAGSLNHTASMEALKLRDSITVYFSNSSGPLPRSLYTQVNRFGDRCQPLPYNVSAEGGRSNFTFDVGDRFSLRGYFVHTSCPDCVVLSWAVKSKRRASVDLYLLSRRRRVEQGDMEEFEAQLKCFDLPPPVLMDPTKELCPETNTEQQPTAAED